MNKEKKKLENWDIIKINYNLLYIKEDKSYRIHNFFNLLNKVKYKSYRN